MKLLLVCALVAVAAAFTLEQKQEHFQAFKAQYARSYLSASEEEFRFKVFSDNLDWIELANQEDKHATYGVTQFTDLTKEEFKDTYTGFRPVGRLATVAPNADLPTVQNDLPDAWDYCDKGECNHVKNQGQCGSCWAFSTMAGLEGQEMHDTSALPNLSEQQLLDCDKDDQACNGGLMHQAYNYIATANAGKADTEDSYPYQARGGSCAADQHDVGVDNVAGYDLYCNLFDESNDVPKKCDEEQMRQAVYDKGVLPIALNAELLQFYMGGIVGTWAPCPGNPDHGVAIVGWGVDGSHPWWKVRNSWGASWGESGYFRILRGKGTCDLNTYAVHAKLNA